MLRTVFIHSKLSRPRQVVFKNREMFIQMHDYTHLQGIHKEQAIEKFLASDLKEGFDLVTGPLFRVQVLRLSDFEHILVFTNHHIILDGWCSRAVLEEFFEIYATLLHQEPVREKKSFSFSKYIQWIENQDKDKAHDYQSNTKSLSILYVRQLGLCCSVITTNRKMLYLDQLYLEDHLN